MFCKKCGKYISSEQKFCPNCGEAAPSVEEDLGMTKIIPNLNEDIDILADEMSEDSAIKPLEEMEDLTFTKEIEYEEDDLAEFDFPEEKEEKFQFAEDEEDYEVSDEENPEELEKLLITNRNKKLNIIAIAVSVSIVMVIVIVAVLLNLTIGKNKGVADETTTVAETTVEGDAETESAEETSEKGTTIKTTVPETTKKKKKPAPIETIADEPTTVQVEVTTGEPEPETEPETEAETEAEPAETDNIQLVE